MVNRERTCLRLFQFSLRDQASNWLERLPAGSITTWEDLTTRFLAQFFPPGRTTKLRNNILMFQQHHGESLYEAWTHFKDLLQKLPHHGIELWLQVQIFMTMSIPSQDEPLTNWPVYCMEDPEQAFVEYASPCTDEAGGRKAHLLEDKQILSVGVFDEVFSTWMAFEENIRNLGTFGEETDKITDLHQIHEEVLFTEREDGVVSIKRRRRELSSDGVRDLATASGHGQLKKDLESST
ncbi:zinc finger, CCHC-type containing protein [Tanacetum coccineum]